MIQVYIKIKAEYCFLKNTECIVFMVLGAGETMRFSIK